MIRKKTKMMLALGAATLVGGTVVTTASANEDLGKCVGVNSCKGQSACQTASSACAGQNACKGKGWIKTTAKDCTSKKGKFESL